MGDTFEDALRKILEESNAAQRLPTMSLVAIDEMEARKHDLDFQYGLCKDMMSKGLLLPFPFGRAAVLLRKAGRFDEELALCEYTEKWAARCEAKYTEGAMIWLSPTIQKLIARLSKLRTE